MNNESSSAKIYWTNDYGKFHFLHGNRDLKQHKVNKLIKAVENGIDLFRYCPILVNETMHIIDGQHRFYVCKKLNHNVYYTIVPDFTLAQIAKLNNNQDKWKNEDFLNCYIVAGKNAEHYKTLEEFKNKYNINITLAVSLLFHGKAHGDGHALENFRNGDFVVHRFEKADLLLKMASEYADFSEICFQRNFLIALERLAMSKSFSHEEMIEKLSKNNLKIEKRSTSKEYLMHMEELFNFKNSKRKTIY